MPFSLENFAIDVTAGRYAVVVAVALVAAVADALWLRIPNWLTFPLLAGGLLFHALAPSGTGITFAISGAIVGFGLLVGFFAAGGMGAGDLKLLAAIGAWIGPHDVLVLFIVSGILVGLGSFALSVWGTRQRRPEKSAQDPAPRTRLLPMGPMIAFALLILLTHNAIY